MGSSRDGERAGWRATALRGVATVANESVRPTNWPLFVVVHFLIALVLAVLVVVSVLCVNALVFVVWLSVVIAAIWEHGRRDQQAELYTAVGIQVGVMAVVVIAALAAPVKLIDRMYSGPVHLPATSMTLGELRDRLDAEELRLPISTYVDVPDHELSRRVEWKSQDLSYRQFVDAIEAQSPLRHHLRACGNTMTILWGVVPGGVVLDVPRYLPP